MKLFSDMEQLFEPFSDEERGRLLTAMMAYCFRGEEPEFTGNERFIWPVLRRHFDLCEEKQRAQEENGKKGGRPPKKENPEKPEETQQNPTKPNETQINPTKPNKTLQEQEQEHIQEQEHKERTVRAARFTPPTVEEVKGYCQERKNTVDPQRFVDFYAAKGWKVGNQAMKDWRAAVRTWEGREGPRGQPIKADFQRRTYTADEYAGMYTDLTAEIAAQKAAR